jgi:short-chain fatty acids transporter
VKISEGGGKPPFEFLACVPLLGLAGLSARDIMGYTTVTVIYSGIILSIFALLIGFKVL